MKYVLYIIIALFVIFIVIGFTKGFKSTYNPGAMIQKAEEKAAQNK